MRTSRREASCRNLFAPLGFAPWMADEAKFSAVGSVAGAGPAYVARFIAALIKAGEERGLSDEIASTIALETVLGTAGWPRQSGEGMDEIARRVASPNGTTEAGLAVLDREIARPARRGHDRRCTPVGRRLARSEAASLAEAARLP